MKKVISLSLFAVLVLVTSVLVSCAPKLAEFDYEMHCLGVGAQGTNLVKVYSYGKNQMDAIENAKLNAIHGILFKGIAGGSGCYQQPPMVKVSEKAAHQEFFDKFFRSKRYLQFVNLSSDGSVNGEDRYRVGNRYKIGVAVSIEKDALRKYLEDQGIIKSLGRFF